MVKFCEKIVQGEEFTGPKQYPAYASSKLCEFIWTFPFPTSRLHSCRLQTIIIIVIVSVPRWLWPSGAVSLGPTHIHPTQGLPAKPPVQDLQGIVTIAIVIRKRILMTILINQDTHLSKTIYHLQGLMHSSSEEELQDMKKFIADSLP